MLDHQVRAMRPDERASGVAVPSAARRQSPRIETLDLDSGAIAELLLEPALDGDPRPGERGGRVALAPRADGGCKVRQRLGAGGRARHAGLRHQALEPGELSLI